MGHPAAGGETPRRAPGVTGQRTRVAPPTTSDGKLEAAGSFKVPAGTKAVVAVSKAGKSVASVRFTLK
ncbi:hypothetical protein AE621_00020 [Acidovorax sp. SD340]|nr:hypothetical protein AE621_00020 [Acidovorax sp. SD340]